MRNLMAVAGLGHTEDMSAQMQVRHLAVDLRKALRGETVASILANADNVPGGRAEVYLRLGSSMVFEPVELLYGHVQRQYKMYADDGMRTFVRQELNHAGYHHHLNSVICSRYVSHPLIGKVNTFIYPLFLKSESLFIDLPVEPTLAINRLKPLARAAGAFETGIGLLEAISLFRTAKRDIDAFIDHQPALYYLFLYHYAEELEHCSEAIRYFETTYGEALWDELNFDLALRDMQDVWTDCAVTAARIAQENGERVSWRDFTRTPVWQERQRLTEEYLRPKSDPIRRLDVERREFIALWDEEWEPRIRQRLTEQQST